LGVKKNKRFNLVVIGRGAHTLPTYRALLNRLSADGSLSVYSEVFIDQKFDAKYRIVSYPFKIHSNKLKIAWLLLVLVRDHLRFRISLIHAHSTYPSGYVAVLMARIFRIPNVIALNAGEAIFLESIQFGQLGNPWEKKKNNWVIANATAITALTRFQALGIQQQYGRWPEIIVRGIDPMKITHRQRTFPLQYTRFLHVGYLHSVKDPLMLIRAFGTIASAMPCRLIQVGNDYMNGEVQAYAQKIGVLDQVEFRGFVPYEEMSSIYQSADVLLHTSQFESQAAVMIEAMAHGLLVLGTRVGLFADLDADCCKTVLPRDAITTLQNTNECARLLQHAQEWSVKYNLYYTAQKYKALYERLLHY
jgi:glycosyltransferase involved in cell wall biosynthesis